MSFKSIAEFLDPANGHRPTTAERKLIEATKAGEPCRLWQGKKPSRPTGPADATTIRATLLRLLILGGTKDCGLHERGVYLIGGWIEGELNLAFCIGKGQTVIDYCQFTDLPILAQVSLPQLSLEHSAFPGLFAQGAQIGGSLSLDSVRATRTVDVSAAKIGGQLICSNATFDGGVDTEGTALAALSAQGVDVGQDLFLPYVIARGTVAVNGAKIRGQFACVGTSFDGGKDRTGTALAALNAQGVEVGDCLLLRSATAKGRVILIGARIGRQLACEDAILEGGKDSDGEPFAALNAQGAEVTQDLFLHSVIANGQVVLSAAKIGGQLTFMGSAFDGGIREDSTLRHALSAQGVRVTEGLMFRELVKIHGLVDLTAAHVGDLVDDEKSWPSTPNDLILDGFTYDRIAGDGPTTFDARRRWLATGSHWQGEFRPQPYTQLARTLRQMGHSGEARKVLMERERLLAEHRLAADRKDYRAAYDGGAMIKGDAGRIWLRMNAARLWSWLTGKVAGYGYAPQYALYWSLACISVSFLAYFLFWRFGAMVPTDAMILTSAEWKAAFYANPLAPALVWAAGSGPATSHYETFYSASYALDVFLPIVDLGQQSTWGQTTVTWTGWFARLFTWGLQAAGYVITTLGLAAATGIIQRNQPD
jgi:hypothetical protein